MPQCNLYTFLTQTTWLIILFYLFYYIMKQYLLPLTYENLQLKLLISNGVTPIRDSSTISKSSSHIFYYNSLSQFESKNI